MESSVFEQLRSLTAAMITGAITVIVLRLLAARYHWNLPMVKP